MALDARRELTEPFRRLLAAPFIALRVPPNVLTLVGLLVCLVPALLASVESYGWAGIAVLIVGALDFLDGTVARATHRATAFGGYLDSVVDRVCDAVILFGIGLGPNDRLVWVLVGAGTVGAYVTSYARARTYQDTVPPPETWNQWFERPERILLLTLILLSQGLWDLVGGTEMFPGVGAYAPLAVGLTVFAVAANATAFVRILKVRQLDRQIHK